MKIIDYAPNFMVKENADGDFKNGSYVRVWKSWGGYCGALNLTKEIEIVMAEKELRIRKLTERECFRLMGLNDSEIDTIQASGVSRNQQYKLAGNSIVVDVLENIFRKMFIEKEQEEQQLKLF